MQVRAAPYVKFLIATFLPVALSYFVPFGVTVAALRDKDAAKRAGNL